VNNEGPSRGMPTNIEVKVTLSERCDALLTRMVLAARVRLPIPIEPRDRPLWRGSLPGRELEAFRAKRKWKPLAQIRDEI
jgi:hypothetical protein